MVLDLPIFPLNTVLYPGGLLPLRIFEQRYLEMTKACLRDDTPFGVCRIREGLEVGSPALPDAVGCTATIEDWDMPHLGLFHLRSRGGQPFRIVESGTQANGLVRARVELLDDIPGTPAAEALNLCRQVLERIIERLGPEGFFTPLDYDNPRWVSYRLCDVLPLAMEDKQALLEARDDGERIHRLQAFLRKVG